MPSEDGRLSKHLGKRNHFYMISTSEDKNSTEVVSRNKPLTYQHLSSESTKRDQQGTFLSNCHC